MVTPNCAAIGLSVKLTAFLNGTKNIIFADNQLKNTGHDFYEQIKGL
jgi:hypothetical protein